MVLPWVYANPRTPIAGIATLGGIVESFRNQRLAGVGAEAGWVLAGLAEPAAEPWMRRTLEGFSRLCLAFADGLPTGTSYVEHLAGLPVAAEEEGPRPRGRSRRGSAASGGHAGSAAPTVGPVDARRLVSEAGYRLALSVGPSRSRHLV